MFRWSRRLTDEEYVERYRQSIIKLDKYRPWIILFWLGIAIGAAPVINLAWNAAMKLAQLGNFGQPANGGAVGFGFLAGLALGAGIGSFLYQIVREFVNAIYDMRSERLMVRYYDLARSTPEASLDHESRSQSNVPVTEYRKVST